ncbi:hypothetical protein P8452_61788 [Trifolium repens]|nr:hypothetical protein P8452_61788 [Trifolium repens]
MFMCVQYFSGVFQRCCSAFIFSSILSNLTGHRVDRSTCNWFGSGTTSFLNLIPSNLIVLERMGFFWKLYKFSVI